MRPRQHKPRSPRRHRIIERPGVRVRPGNGGPSNEGKGLSSARRLADQRGKELSCGRFVIFGIATDPNFSCKAKAMDGIARRAGRSPERSEGSSRSRGRAALAELRKQESPTGLPGVSADVAWRADGIWKARRGCFGGAARGAEKGAQPHNRPRLAARRAGGQNNKQRKSPRARRAAKNLSQRTSSFPPQPVTAQSRPMHRRTPAGRQNSHPKGQAFSLSIPADHAILPAARRPTTTAEASLMSGNRRFPSHTHAQDPKP